MKRESHVEVPAPYRIKNLLGAGGMAEVYLADNEDLRRSEAIKFLLERLTSDDSIGRRFLHEAQIGAGLSHPNIVPIFAVSAPNSPRPFFTMQYIEGGDLAEHLDKNPRMRLDDALQLLTQIAKGLDHAHSKNVLHRDVKPANVLLHQDGSGELRAYVADFGIAQAQEADGATRLTRAGAIIGTPEYMSPEQAGAGGEVGPYSDQYSLGVMAFEMLCGQVPFPASAGKTDMTILMEHVSKPPPSPSTFRSDLNPVAEKAILKALSKNPSDRFRSCRAFVEALTVSATPTASSIQGGNVEALGRTKVRSPIPILAGALVVGLTLIGIALTRPKPPTEPPPSELNATHVAPLPPPVSPLTATKKRLREIDRELAKAGEEILVPAFVISHTAELREIEEGGRKMIAEGSDDEKAEGYYFLAKRKLTEAMGLLVGQPPTLSLRLQESVEAANNASKLAGTNEALDKAEDLLNSILKITETELYKGKNFDKEIKAIRHAIDTKRSSL